MFIITFIKNKKIRKSPGYLIKSIFIIQLFSSNNNKLGNYIFILTILEII